MLENFDHIADFRENVWNFDVAMKWSENRIYSIILLRKVVSLKSIYLNESYTVYRKYP